MLRGFDTHPDPVGIKSKSDGKYDFFRTKIPSGFEELFLAGEYVESFSREINL
jgi:hypothetical protein